MNKKQVNEWVSKICAVALGLALANQNIQANSVTNGYVAATQTASLQKEPLRIIDVSEAELEGAPVLRITFSEPILPEQSFSSWITVTVNDKPITDGAWEVSRDKTRLYWRHIEPESRYEVQIEPKIMSVNKTRLILDDKEAEQQKYGVETKAIVPSIGFASQGSLLPSSLSQGLPVLAVNVNKIDVDFFRVKESKLPQFLAGWNNKGFQDRWAFHENSESLDLVYSGRFDLDIKKNRRETFTLPMDSIEALKKSGAYIAVIRQVGEYTYYNLPATMFTLSDIGLVAHRYNNRIDFFAQSLANGQPFKGVTVTLLDKQGGKIATKKTDEKGYGFWEEVLNGELILATFNGQTSIITLNKAALDLSEFTLSGKKDHPKQFFAFGPRDLYRAGETVSVNGLMRDRDGKPLPDQRVTVEIVKPDQQVARSFSWKAEDGLYQYEYVIPEKAPRGKWSMRFNLGDDVPSYYHFQVEDFLPERMALNITKPDPILLDAQESAIFDIDGNYLYGAPAAGNVLQGQLKMKALREAVTALPGFEFGSITEKNLQRTIHSYQVKLNDKGQYQLAVKSEWKEIQSPIQLMLSASLQESGGRPVTRNAEQSIWPTEHLFGIRPLFSKKRVYDYQNRHYAMNFVTDEDSLAEFEIVYSDSNGNKITAEDVEVRLFKEQRDYYWRWSNDRGWRSHFDQKDFAIAKQVLTIVEEGSNKVTFPIEWGSYRLEVKHPDNPFSSSIRFWAGYSWQENNNSSNLGSVRPDQVKLKIDKPSYQLGETLTVQVEPPAEGKGYLLVESSDGPLWHKEIEVPAGGATFEIPLSKDWARHDLYLNAMVIRKEENLRHATPKRAIGLLHIPLASQARKVNLDMALPVKMEPDNLLKVKVKANNYDGVPLKGVKVLLSAVDSGVLNITQYKTPDPFSAFFGRKHYGADLFDVYGQLIEGNGRRANLRFGGDDEEEQMGGGGSGAPPSFVKVIAQQAKPITLDDEGNGEIEMYIPEFNGELRIMAQAWTDELFGSQDSKVIVAAPIVMELSLPRFMASGDSSETTLELHNLSGRAQEITLQAEASDLLVMEPLKGLNAGKINLYEGEKKNIILKTNAKQGLGKGTILVVANGVAGDNGTTKTLKVERSIGIRPPYPIKTETFAQTLVKNGIWKLPKLAELTNSYAATTLQGQLVVSHTPTLDLNRYMTELRAYPYGCLEQTTSGIFPSLYVNNQQLSLLGIKADSDEERRDRIRQGIERLLYMQKDSGGFGFWSQGSSESFWGTVYVTDFLFRAKEQGYSIPEKSLERVVARLQRYLLVKNQINTSDSDNRAATQFSVRAYAAFVLARQQKVSLATLRQLFNESQDTPSGLALVQLSVALKLMGDEVRSEQALIRGLNLPRDRTNSYMDYGSSVRDTALIYNLMMEYNMEPSLQGNVMISLINELGFSGYLSTQENNSLFLAGRHALNGVHNDDKVWMANLDGKTQKNWQQSKPMSYMLSGEELISTLRLHNQGDEALYAKLVVSGYPKNLPKPESNQVTVERTYYNKEGTEVTLDELAVGELLYVHIKATTGKNRLPDALIVDLLPAGLEIENQNLGASSVNLDEYPKTLNFLKEGVSRTDIQHQEYRDDRYIAAVNLRRGVTAHVVYLARAVTPGEYKVPPTLIESMYQPEIRAIGKTVERVRIIDTLNKKQNDLVEQLGLQIIQHSLLQSSSNANQ